MSRKQRDFTPCFIQTGSLNMYATFNWNHSFCDRDVTELILRPSWGTLLQANFYIGCELSSRLGTWHLLVKFLVYGSSLYCRDCTDCQNFWWNFCPWNWKRSHPFVCLNLQLTFFHKCTCYQSSSCQEWSYRCRPLLIHSQFTNTFL